MEKTIELQKKLAETFSNKTNWNKFIEIDGMTFYYNSLENKIRRLHNQPSGTIAMLVACFAFNKFMWCC